MSPTVLRVGGYRFYFFSREEAQPHVHVQHSTGELAHNYGLSPQRLAAALRLTEEHHAQILAAWHAHFGR